MLKVMSVLRNALGALALLVSANGMAQDLPGSAVSDSVVNQSAITLIGLAQQRYPELFTGATSWRTFDGFLYKYYSASGVYVGINGPDLYLLGGPFGNTVQYQGTVADALVALQGNSNGSSGSGSTSQLFKSVTSNNTLRDLLGYFSSITLSYGTVTSFANLQAAVALEAQGQEQVDGATADVVALTLTGNNLSAPVSYKMWVNAQGTIVKLRQNGYDFLMPASNAVGAGLVSGMLIALKAADAPSVRAALNDTLQDSAAVSQKTHARTISGLNVQTLSLQIGDGASTTVLLEVSDFGSFSMATKMSSTLGGSTTSFEITSAALR